MFPKIVILVLFLGILASLASALTTMVRKKEGSPNERMAKALTMRIGLSVALFVLLFILFALGMIRPHGLGG